MNASATYGGAEAERSRTIGLVPFLFGLADGPTLPAAVLNRLLVDLGMSPAAAKAQLARMRQRGQLATTRRGRTVDYRLAGPFAESFQRIRTWAPSSPSWDGSFHALLYQVPEAARAFRDQFRRNALLVGYGLLQQGVLIAVDDRSGALAGILADRPANATVYPARLRLSLPDARTAAATAWALPDVARRYLRHCRTLRAALADSAHRPESGPTAVRRLAELMNAPAIDSLLAPDLPAELLPEDWPSGQLADLIGRVAERYGPAASGYVRSLVNTPQ